MKHLNKFFYKNRIELIIFGLIIVLAAFLRFYQLPEYMTFLGDEGRDALIVEKILVNHNFPLLGAPTSVGNMYNGPLYYYMMAIPMAIFWLNPAAAAGMVAVIGTLTVGLIYYLSRQWFGKSAAIFSSILYAISPINIIYSRSSWNPNPAPFFSCLMILGLYLSHKSRNYLWFILVGITLAFVIQMHLLALILIPMIVILWALEVYLNRLHHYKTHHFWKGTVIGLLTFLFLMSPMAIFDFRHNFMNYKAFTAFFFGDRATTVNLNILNSLYRVFPIYQYNLIDRYFTGPVIFLEILVGILVLVPVLYFLYLLFKNKALNWPFLTLSLWMLGGVLGLSLYKQTIYDHYTSFFNPAPFILLGSMIYIFQRFKFSLVKKVLLVGMGGLFIALIIINQQRSPLLMPPNNQLARTQDISQYLIRLSDNKPFNFALISAHNYDAAYQYYLALDGHKPQVLPDVITDQLLVVCEDPVCKPINNPKYEIAAFGWAKIGQQTQYDGVQIFKLVHSLTTKP